jgi:hypothetical protein
MSQRGGRGARPGGGAPAAPGGGGPAANAGARGALLLAVAVILGIVLLQKFDSGTIDTGGNIATGTSVVQTTTTRRVGLTTVPVVTTTTVKTRAKADVKVVVANGAGVKGLGATTTNVLKNAGYTTLSPTDATAQVDKTSIQFAEGYDAEARELAQTLSLPPAVAVKLNSPPVAAADIGDAKIVVILGVDLSTTTSSTPAAGAGTTSTTRKP